MKKLNRSKISIAVVVMLTLVLAFALSACNSAEEISKEAIAEAKTLIGEAKDEFAILELQVAALAIEGSANLNTVIADAKKALESVESALRNETQKGIDEANAEISKLKNEIPTSQGI